MKIHLKKTFLIALLIPYTLVATAQISVSGKIINSESKKALKDAYIVSSGGNTAVSDIDGQYYLKASKTDTLTISLLGFEQKILSIESLLAANKFDIYLTPNQLLEGVTLTASIASARSQKAIGADVDRVDVAGLMEKINASSITDVLDGRVSGVQMYQSNGKIGMPIRFNMRSGATLSMDRDPLIYVDGVRYNSTHISDINTSQDALGALNDLPMEDIASIDIIKGPAAAASYGSEAANGVIVITTKRGSREAEKMDINFKLTQGFSSLAKKYTQFVNNTPLNDFFETGSQTNAYLNISKTFSKGNQLYFSANENQSSGIIPGNTDKRHTFRAAYDLRHRKLKLKANASYINGEISIPQTAQSRYDAIWNLMRTQQPWQYISELSWRAQSWKYNNNRIIGTMNIGYTLPWGINAETLLGIDNNTVQGKYLLPYGYLVGTNDQGQKKLSNRVNSNFNWDFKLNKRYKFNDKWNMTFTILSQLVRQHEASNIINAEFFSGDVDNIAAASKITVTETSFEQRTWGLYGEAFLNYNNCLFVNAGLRRDASNLIGSNIASILYPSLSVAYNINDIKIRTAYGESGRLPYPTDARTMYTMSGSSAYGPTVKPSTKGNPNIRPERMREIELGVDMSVKKQHFSLTGYAQFTNDAIIYVPLRSSMGWVGNMPENIGKVQGQGIELSWNGNIWQSINKANSLNFYVMVNYQRNRVKNTGGRIIDNYPNVIKNGQPAYAFYYLEVEGPVFDNNGIYKGAKESSEAKYLGKPYPDFNGSFGLDWLLAKYLTIGCKFSYATGASVYNQSFYNVAGLGDNLKKRDDLLQALDKEQPRTDAYKKTATALSYTERMRSNYIEKADFIRLSTLTAGYNFSPLINKFTKGTLKHCKLALSVHNVFLITNYSGAEPLIESNGGVRQTRGIGSLSRDITNAPTPRTFTAALSFNF